LVSHICIFPSDGTSRIRFTGLGYESHSQPDASGSPKTYLRAIYIYYIQHGANVKKKSGRSRASPAKYYAISRASGLPPRM